MSTLLSKDLESNTYKVNGKASLANPISVSSKRELVLNEVESLQDSFFEKYKLFETEKALHPMSEHAKQLLEECESLATRSRELLDTL